MSYTFHFSQVVPYLGLMAKGLMVSILITAISAIFGTGLGLLSAVARLSTFTWLRRIADVYVEVVRNTPLLIQMYLLYFGLGQFDIQIPPTVAAIMAMAINTGAYTTVIFQSGINAVDAGQREAALSLGLTSRQVFRHVILPPAFRIVFPMLVNQTLSVFLFSSVASTITVPELTHQTLHAEAQTFRTFEVFAISTLFYFVCAFLLSVITSRFERLRPVR